MKIINNKKLNVFTVGDNFKAVFGDPEYKEEKCKVKSTVLPEYMSVKKIVEDLSPQKFTLNEMLTALHDETIVLDKTGMPNVFFIGDVTISAMYQMMNGEGSWGLNVHPISDLSSYGAGRRIMSKV